MKIAIACDHGGLNLKKALIEYLVKNGYEYVDFGTDSTESCDYPDYALPAAESVARGEPIAKSILGIITMRICSLSGKNVSARA